VSGSSRHSGKSRSTNVSSAGGTFRGRSEKRGRKRKSKAPPVDMLEWQLHCDVIQEMWTNLLNIKGFTALGGALFDQVPNYPDTIEPLFRFSNREVQGTKFMDMLGSIIDNVNSPELIFRKISELAPMHHRLGVKASHMPIMKGLLFKVFEDALGNAGFSQAEQSAWGSVWDYMTICMTQTLEEVGSTLSVVRDSWDLIMNKVSAEDIGRMIYEKLFQLAPNVANIFTKPKQEMAIKMGNMLEASNS
jgi:hemoglobin-like flavoprotein